MSSIRAASATVLVMGPTVLAPDQASGPGLGTRPMDGLRPTTPQQPAAPGAGCGAAVGPAAIPAPGQRCDPGGDGRGRAAAGAARRCRRIPWIAGDPGQLALGDAEHAEFWGGGLPDQDRARCLQPRP